MKRLILLIALAIAASGCGPSCEERGGELVFSHFYTTYIFVGKMMVPQTHSHYKCVLPEPPPAKKQEPKDGGSLVCE